MLFAQYFEDAFPPPILYDDSKGKGNEIGENREKEEFPKYNGNHPMSTTFGQIIHL